jgi:hypothetical protein
LSQENLMRHILISTLLLSMVALPAIAAELLPLPLPSKASWFDPATKTATSAELTADPNYSRIKKEEKAADSAFRSMYEAKCIAAGVYDVGCFAATRTALLQKASAYTDLPVRCSQWKSFWKKEVYSQLSLRNDICTKEADTSLYNHAMNNVNIVGCVCN